VTMAPTNPLVGVAVPVRRRADYVGAAIESVLEQSYPHWRLIVSENGHGGGAIERAVTPYLTDGRVSFVSTGSDLPASESWSTAIARTSGTYVALLNDDDVWHPQFLERRVNALAAHPECGFAFSPMLVVDAHRNVIRRWEPVFESGVVPPLDFLRMLLARNVVPITSVLMRRTAFECIGPHFDGNWVAFDWELWVRLAARFPVVFLSDPDNEYRVHGNQQTYLHHDNLDDYARLFEHFDRLAAAGPWHYRRTDRERRAALTSVVLTNAMAAMDAGAFAEARALCRDALRGDTRALFDPRYFIVAGGSFLGKRGRKPLRRLRRLANSVR